MRTMPSERGEKAILGSVRPFRNPPSLVGSWNRARARREEILPRQAGHGGRRYSGTDGWSSRAGSDTSQQKRNSNMSPRHLPRAVPFQLLHCWPAMRFPSRFKRMVDIRPSCPSPRPYRAPTLKTRRWCVWRLWIGQSTLCWAYQRMCKRSRTFRGTQHRLEE